MIRVSKEEGIEIYRHSGLHEIGRIANNIKEGLHPERVVTFIVDRNINYTNICVNRCKFCAFYRDATALDAYLLTNEEIFRKIEETLELEGTQILLQGGIHKGLDIDYYCNLLRAIKERFTINIHGLSPTEIVYLSNRHSISILETLQILKAAGIDSIPGGGAEILSDRVRKKISPNKISSAEWLDVMETAHNIGMKTTATMMFGSIEEDEDILSHLEYIRSLQDRTGGFTAFIPWSFQPGNTRLAEEYDIMPATAADYLRIVALSRIYLDNIINIQASWVTQGLKLAQVALLFGANDFGSTMLEENVVRSAGVSHSASKGDIINSIRQAGFIPVQRDTYYRSIKRYD